MCINFKAKGEKIAGVAKIMERVKRKRKSFKRKEGKKLRRNNKREFPGYNNEGKGPEKLC